MERPLVSGTETEFSERNANKYAVLSPASVESQNWAIEPLDCPTITVVPPGYTHE